MLYIDSLNWIDGDNDINRDKKREIWIRIKWNVLHFSKKKKKKNEYVYNTRQFIDEFFQD